MTPRHAKETTMTTIRRLFTKRVRAYIYGLAAAFVPVAIYYGWIEPEAAPIVLPFLLALLNLSDDDTTTGPA